MGSDPYTLATTSPEAVFQSTLPVWGATGLAAENGVILDISIHAPRVGSDVRLVHQKEEDKISIHAPRVGSDGKILASYHIITSYFNPRSPCGERRLFRPMRIPACRRISIHAPRVGSDCRRAYAELGGVKFQSTLPVWGATRRICRIFFKIVFQSTLPVWGATPRSLYSGIQCEISIHAPRVGSDL